MKKTITLLLLLLFSFQLTSFAEGTQEQIRKTGLSISPATFSIEQDVKQGTNEFLINLKVKNDSTQAQAVKVIQEGYMKPEKEDYVVPMGATIEIPVYLDVPKEASIGKRDDSILLKTTHTQDKILQYRIISSFNIVDGGLSNDKSKDKETFKEVAKEIVYLGSVLYIVVGAVILLIVIAIIFVIRRKIKRNNLYELYKK